MRTNKNTAVLAKKPKTSKLAATDKREKPVDFFHDTARASTFAPTIILLTRVPLQKYLFLLNLKFLD